MIKRKYIIIASVFLVVSVILASLVRNVTPLFPTQEDQAIEKRNSFGSVQPTFVFRQEIVMKKEYLAGIDCWLGNFQMVQNAETVVMVTDTNLNILFSERFNSDKITNPTFYHFSFPKKLKLGKGTKFYYCLYSTNATQELCLSTVKNDSLITGNRLLVFPMQNNDALGAMHGAGQYIPGTLLYKTYESNSPSMNWMRWLLYFIALLLTAVILFWEKIRAYLSRVHISAEKVYLGFAIPFGLAFVFFTGPFQVPDEDKHFFRAYQVAEGNLFGSDNTVPKAVTNIDSVFQTMRFKAFVKTSIKDIRHVMKQFPVTKERRAIDASPYLVPLIPQAIGIRIGKIFGASLLGQFYYARVFNLLFSLLILFFAIWIMPWNKWIFFLLGLMPMTVYLFSSVSHDALNITLPFLLLAALLRVIYDVSYELTPKRLAWMLVLVALVAMCKPPYFMIAFLLLLIPVSRAGSWKKYGIIVGAMILAIGIGNEFFPAGHRIFTPPPAPAVVRTVIPDTSIADSAAKKKAYDQTKPLDNTNMSSQKEFILHNPGKYADILYNSMFDKQRKFYVDSFVGKYGWLDTPLPGWVIFWYYFVLIFAAIVLAYQAFHVGWKMWLLMAAIFFGGILLIETAMYIAWSPVGNEVIEGVQGRYFIPLAPLFLMLFSTRWLAGKLAGLTIGVKRTVVSKSGKPVIKEERLPVGTLAGNILIILMLIFTFIVLLTATYITLTRFFVVTV
jgi:uncharacterized membrane protein